MFTKPHQLPLISIRRRSAAPSARLRRQLSRKLTRIWAWAGDDSSRSISAALLEDLGGYRAQLQAPIQTVAAETCIPDILEAAKESLPSDCIFMQDNRHRAPCINVRNIMCRWFADCAPVGCPLPHAFGPSRTRRLLREDQKTSPNGSSLRRPGLGRDPCSGDL